MNRIPRKTSIIYSPINLTTGINLENVYPQTKSCIIMLVVLQLSPMRKHIIIFKNHKFDKIDYKLTEVLIDGYLIQQPDEKYRAALLIFSL